MNTRHGQMLRIKRSEYLKGPVYMLGKKNLLLASRQWISALLWQVLCLEYPCNCTNTWRSLAHIKPSSGTIPHLYSPHPITYQLWKRFCQQEAVAQVRQPEPPGEHCVPGQPGSQPAADMPHKLPARCEHDLLADSDWTPVACALGCGQTSGQGPGMPSAEREEQTLNLSHCFQFCIPCVVTQYQNGRHATEVGPSILWKVSNNLCQYYEYIKWMLSLRRPSKNKLLF